MPTHPDINVPASYWNTNIAAMDAEKKKYRAIPVPALLNPKQKHIDDEVALREFVEFLATKNDFGNGSDPFDIRLLQGMTPEGIMDQISVWADEVDGASEAKKESAQRSFGGHLEDFGASIGRGLLGGVMKVMGAPGVSHTLSALSAPGEETTAQILYNIARIMPGEQDIERGVNKWRKENPDAPWWKRHTLTSAVRAEGFGVPMGLHLPMEIIFDPLNLIPVGAAFKLAKPTKVMLKLMRKGKSSKEAFRLTKRLMRYQAYSKQKAALLSDEAIESVDIFNHTDYDLSAEDIYKEFPYLRDLDDAAAFAYGSDQFSGKSRAGARRHQAGPEGGPGADEVGELFEKNVNDYVSRVVDPVLRNPEIAEDIAKSRKQYRKDTPIEQKPDLTRVEDDDLAMWPGVRGIPNRGSAATNDGLYAIAHDEESWQKLYEISHAAGLDGEKAKWALQLMWHTGIRPNEIEYIRWSDVLRMLEDTSSGPKYLKLSVKEAGAKVRKESNRLLDDDAIDFLRRYKDKVRHTYNEEAAGFVLPNPIKGESSISGLQRHFVEMARNNKHREAYGEDLLKFYDNNKNFSYVFRLSKANDVWSKTKKIKGLKDLMGMMGH